MQRQAKVRGPVTVAILSIVTLGLYTAYYWYVINRELADQGRALGTDELGTSPGRSLAALVPGVLLIVPAIWTTVTTFRRVQAAQRLAGRAPIDGWIGLVLYVCVWPAYFGYLQSGLNSVWATGGAAADPLPATA
jgi:hypothetical protein